MLFSFNELAFIVVTIGSSKSASPVEKIALDATSIGGTSGKMNTAILIFSDVVVIVPFIDISIAVSKLSMAMFPSFHESAFILVIGF